MKLMLFKTNAVLAALLMALYVSWWWALGASLGGLPLAVLAAAILPVALLTPALWSGKRFGMSLAGFIIPLHFAYAVMELVANPEARAWIAVQTFLSLVLFAGVMAGLRQVSALPEQRDPASREDHEQKES